MATYTFKNFSMRIAFPKLNYSLFVELTTNIEDFIFMIIQDVKVSKEANIQYNGTATPQYFSTNADGKNDRVVIDFGFVRVGQLKSEIKRFLEEFLHGTFRGSLFIM